MRPTTTTHSLLAVLGAAVGSARCAGYSESITGYSTLGDHFGYPAFANAKYDYVVVGGGTAGLTIATRLAEGGAGTVAVIEAGGFYELDNGNLSSVPGTAAFFIGTAPGEHNPLIDWEYQTEPEAVSSEQIRLTAKQQNSRAAREKNSPTDLTVLQ